MTDKFIRKYKLTIGNALSFYQGDVGQTPFADRSETEIRGFEVKDRIEYENNFTNSRFIYDKFDPARFTGIEITDLNISFYIEDGEGKNQSEITICNLSDENRKLLDQVSKAKPIVKLECGYVTDDELPLIFQGEIIRVIEAFEGTTRKTRLLVKAGASNMTEAYSIRAYKKGTTVETIVKDMISDLKLPYGTVYIPRVNENAIVIDKNFYANGKTVDILKAICNNYDLIFNVARTTVVNVIPRSRDDKVQPQGTPSPVDQLTQRGFSSRLIDTQELRANRTDVIRNAINDFDNTSPERKGYKINKDVGFTISNQDQTLIGYPVLESGNEAVMENGSNEGTKIRFKTLMNGLLEVGKRVNLQSRFESGVYVIDLLQYRGEYEGNDWYVECVATLTEDWTVAKQ